MIQENVMPYVQEMNGCLDAMKGDGISGLRMFVQRSSDITEDDLAADFLRMEEARRTVPYSIDTSI